MSQPMDENSSTSPGGRSGNRLPIILGLAAVGIVILGFVAWTLFSGDAPAAVDLDAATSELTDDDTGDAEGTSDSTADDTSGDTDSAAEQSESAEAEESADEASGETTEAAPISNVSGDWTIDTSIGEFSFENSTGTYVGFRVGEELTTVGETEAVGRTPAVAGMVSIDGETVTAVIIEADMTAITTDIARRDDAARRALGTDSFPGASFVLTEPIELGIDPASGEPFAGTAVGDLTVHGVTNPVELNIDAQLVGNTIAIVGSTDVVFADYGVTAPSAPVVARLDDSGVIEFQLFLTQS